MLSLFLGLSLADDSASSYGASASQEVHKVEGCDIGNSYDIWNMNCQKAPAFYTPDACTDEDATSANCIASEATGHWTYYNCKTTTSTDTEELMSTAVTAEGSGWGVSVSASADYMQSHSLTSNSVTYWIGMAGEAYSESFQAPLLLELTEAASTTLASNWETFVAMYGTHYISEVIYTTKFIGSLAIHSTSEENKSDLDLAISMDYKGMCEASGTATFTDATSGTSGSLTTKLSAQWDGGAREWDTTADGVTQMNKAYADWQDANLASPKDNSVATKMVYKSYMHLAQVQKIITDNYDTDTVNEIIDTFYMAVPTATTMEYITKDYLMAKTQQNSLELYKTYDCADTLNLTDTIESYIKSLISHTSLLEHMDAADLAQRQTDIDEGNFDWFIGHSLDYTTKIEAEMAGCMPPTPSPTQDLGCVALSYNGRCGEKGGKQMCSTWFNSAYRYCNYNTGYCESTTANRDKDSAYDEENIRVNCDPYHRASVVDSTCNHLDAAYPWRGPNSQQHGTYPVCFKSHTSARKRTYTCGEWCCIPGSEWRCKNFGCADWITCGVQRYPTESPTASLRAMEKWEADNVADSSAKSSPSKTLRNLVERNFVSTKK